MFDHLASLLTSVIILDEVLKANEDLTEDWLAFKEATNKTGEQRDNMGIDPQGLESLQSFSLDLDEHLLGPGLYVVKKE